MEAIIRPYTSDDSGSVKFLFSQFVSYHEQFDDGFVKVREHADLFADYIELTIGDDAFNCSVAEVENKVIGYCVSKIEVKPPVYPNPSYGYIDNLCVSEGHQRQGIGLRLVDDAMAWFKTKNMSRIECFAAIQNPKSTSFWRKAGFQPLMEQMYYQL